MINVFLINCDDDRLKLLNLDKKLNIEVVKTGKQKNRLKGCYDAHYKIAEIARDRNLTDYVCMEDNIENNKYSFKRFCNIISDIRKKELKFVYLAQNPKPFYIEYKKYFNDIYKSKVSCNGTVCYYIHRDWYLELLENPFYNYEFASDEYYYRNKCKIDYLIIPGLFKRSLVKTITTFNKMDEMYRPYYFNKNIFKMLEDTELYFDFNIFLIILIVIFFILFVLVILSFLYFKYK